MQIYGRVQSLVEAAEGGCILIEGDAGMGKSRLMEEIQRSPLGGKRDALTMLISSAVFDHRSQVLASATIELQWSAQKKKMLSKACSACSMGV